jgi:integrase
MASITKRTSKSKGTRYTVRVRLKSKWTTETFGSKAAAEAWARVQEGRIETREFVAPPDGGAMLIGDAVDSLRAERASLRRPPGATFSHALKRLKQKHGLEVAAAFDWLKYAKDRIAAGARGSTVAGDLAYATSVLTHAAEHDPTIDGKGPARARAALRKLGLQMTSRERNRRITDAEIAALLTWIDANAERTSLPLRDLVEFALATGMRRGEILALEWTDIRGRIANIKRKHPTERDRRENVPLLRPKRGKWPRVDPLAIINRQPRQGPRIFPYLGDTLGFWFEKACEGAGIKGVVFHQLRHECLSRLADRGFDPLRLAMVGGHRDLRNVKRYAKLDAEKLANE